MKTGWLSEDPDDSPAMPVTAMLLGRHEHRASVLETALARSRAQDVREAREQAASAPDPDERAANLLAAGYQPGLLYELQQRLSDVQAELETERDKIEKAARRSERLARDHAAGRIGAWDVMRMMQDFDEGDSYRCEQLERRAAGISREIAEATQAISPPQQRDPDPIASATRAAHDEFVAVTRAMLAGAPRPTAPRPFESASRGAGRSTEHVEGNCWVCENGRKRDAAWVSAAEAADDAAYDAEVTRLTDSGYSLAIAQEAATPLISR